MAQQGRDWLAWATLGRLIALVVLVVGIVSLLTTVNVEHLDIWLILGLAVAFLVG